MLLDSRLFVHPRAARSWAIRELSPRYFTSSSFNSKYIVIILLCISALIILASGIRRWRRASARRALASAARTPPAPPPPRPQQFTPIQGYTVTPGLPPNASPAAPISTASSPYQNPNPLSSPPGPHQYSPPTHRPTNLHPALPLLYPPAVQPYTSFSHAPQQVPPPGAFYGSPGQAPSGRPSWSPPGGAARPAEPERARLPRADSERPVTMPNAGRVLRQPDYREGGLESPSPLVSPTTQASSNDFAARSPDHGGNYAPSSNHNMHPNTAFGGSSAPAPAFGNAMTVETNGEVVLSLAGPYPLQEKVYADQRRAFRTHDVSSKPEEEEEAGPASLDYMAPNRVANAVPPLHVDALPPAYEV